jgi:hypothetical protein
VGSSNNLPYRFKQYLSIFSNPDYQGGKLASLILKEGSFYNFKLEIVVIPSSFTNFKNYKFFHCFIEQYHLLSYSGFNLNSQSIVNFRANLGKQLYLYNKDMSILLYQAHSKIIFITDTSISHASITKYKDKSLYLDMFYISDELKFDAVPVNLSSTDIRALIDKYRNKESCPYYLYNEDFTILYYRGNTKASLQKNLKIDSTSVNRSKATNKLYLNIFRISKEHHQGAAISDMSLDQLNSLLDEKRKLKTTSNRPVYVYNKDLTILYYKVTSTSLLSRDLGINVRKGDSIKNYIGTEASILNFKLSYVLNSGSKNKLLTLDEMKKLVVYMKDQAFGHNKQISIQCLESGEVITVRSVDRTVSYLKEKGISTTAVTIKNYLEKSKSFKGYFFKYIQ